MLYRHAVQNTTSEPKDLFFISFTLVSYRYSRPSHKPPQALTAILRLAEVVVLVEDGLETRRQVDHVAWGKVGIHNPGWKVPGASAASSCNPPEARDVRKEKRIQQETDFGAQRWALDLEVVP